MAYRNEELISAGDLNLSIVIEAPTITSDEITGWTPVETVRAGKRTPRGREIQEGGGIAAEQIAIWTMRYRPYLAATHRIVHGADVWEIVAPPNDVNGANRRLDVTARLVK